ncbi:MAG: lysylphosphatidylglycerol synthase transmembrane domain-containing protein [Catalinimonas sp.]
MLLLRLFLKYVLPLGLAALLLWLVYRDTSLEELMRDLRDADYRWIFLSIIPAVISHLSRAERWRLLLRPLGHRPRLLTSFLAVMSLYFVNLILPRAGEVSRCGVLRKTDGVPIDASVGTVVAERGFDLLMLLLTVAVAFVLEFSRLSTVLGPLVSKRLATVEGGAVGLLLVGGLSVAGAVVALFLALRRRLRGSALYGKIEAFLEGVWAGLISVRHLDRPGAFVLHTVLIWGCYYLMAYWALFALPATADLGARAALMVFTLGSLGMVAPVQGGVGAYHFMVGAGLALYGVSEADASAAAALMHTSQTLFLLLLGGICFGLTFLVRSKRELVYDGK